ncbi:MAG: molecular chaperone DnaJ [Candidatus Diapherotrites archaeon]|nr:molecular chaperone DnaJ [Candidatus Diapherotrites archaeon]
MAEKRGYYDVLGVGKNASPEEIRDAYKRLAKKFHPDVNKEAGAEEKFKEALEAYSVLNDPEKRRVYDQHGFEGTRFQGFSGFQEGFDFSDFVHENFNFGDIFSQFGGFGFDDVFKEAFGIGSRPANGNHVRVDLSLSFEEAAFGTTKEIEVARIGTCESCKGSGAKKGSTIDTCATCRGTGIETHTRRTGFGIFQTQTTCTVCGGRGKAAKERCPECHGKGRMRTLHHIEVTIPPGIDSNQHLRIKNQGHAGTQGGQAGDLYVVITVKPHKVFKRDGPDVFCDVPMGIAEAALGTPIEVPTIHGKADISIPSGTQNGTVFRLKGKGIKRLNGAGNGDHYVRITIKVPERLTKKQRDLLEAFAVEEGMNVKRKGFFDEVLKKFKSKKQGEEPS